MSQFIFEDLVLLLCFLLELLFHALVGSHCDTFFSTHELFLLHLACLSLLEDFILDIAVCLDEVGLAHIILEKLYDFNTLVFNR